jgi:thiamine-phosphate pyrophosphorylase
MITDRARFAGGGDALVERVAAAARAGVHLVQIRERDMEGAALLRLVAACVAAVRGTRTRVLVNDRVDVALAAAAHGVHLRADSMPAPRIRRIAADSFLIGRSVHSIADVRRAEEEGGVDYLLFGTVFETASKPGVAAAGDAALREAVSATRLPVLAIGGVTPATLPRVAAAGAAGFAAIGLFAAGAAGSLQLTVQQASAAFDTPSAAP